MIDWAISLGNILTVLAIVFVGGGFYYQQVTDSRRFRSDILDIKTDLKILNKIIMDIALQSQRLDNQAERINRTEKAVDDLRRGKGYINNDGTP